MHNALKISVASCAFIFASPLLGAMPASLLGVTAAEAQIIFKKREKAPKPECFCTDRYGKRRELGDIICLTVGGRSYEAKCIMAQNNPFWRDLERGCLNSNLSPQKTVPTNQSPINREVANLYQQAN